MKAEPTGTKRTVEVDTDPAIEGHKDEASLEALLEERVAPKSNVEDEARGAIRGRGWLRCGRHGESRYYTGQVAVVGGRHQRRRDCGHRE